MPDPAPTAQPAGIDLPHSFGAALLRAAEEWGRAQGCTEFASDADPENAISIDAHLALGFEDAGLVRCFRKSLGD